MSRWSVEPILDSFAVVAVLVAMLLLLLVAVRPIGAKLSAARKRILLILRGTLIGLLMLAMLRPAFVSSQQRPQSATVIVLVDQTRSMRVQDAAQGTSRWQSLADTMARAEDELGALASLMDVMVYGFDEKLSPLKVDQGTVSLPSDAVGRQTDIGAALDEAIRREVGQRLAAVILLSDGAQRVFDPRVDMQQAARDLARRDCPLFTVPFGLPRDQSQARDVAVENFQDQYAAFVNNEIQFRGSVRVQGYLNQPIPVTIRLEGPDSFQQTLGPNLLNARQNDQLLDFEFLFSPPLPGSYRMVVEAAAQPGELVVDNNRLTAYLTAMDGGLRILYLESDLLGPEPQLLRQAIRSAQDLQLDYRPIDPRNSSEWPIDLSADLASTDYDVYLIGNVPAAAIGATTLTRIAEDVQRGKGLMMTGGMNTFGPGDYRDSPLADVLPITMGRFERQDFGPDATIREDLHLNGPLQAVPVRRHFVTHLGGREDSLESWQKLKPLLGANKFDAVKPRASVLLETSDQRLPLLVAWQYGQGRVLAFAADTTHRWARFGEGEAHKRFWRQAILWLGNKDEMMRRDVWLQLSRRRFRPGESVSFVAGARDTSGDPLAGAELKATVTDPTGRELPVRLLSLNDGWTGDVEDLREPGEYQIEVVAEVDGQPVGTTNARFLVQDQDLELSDPAANPEQLAQLSRVTESSGGKSIQPEQFSDLIRQLRETPPEMIVEVESKWRFGDTAADTWTFFLAAVGILVSEWYLRKRWGLV